MARDVLLHIEAAGDGYVATLRDPAGDRNVAFSLPIAVDHIDGLLDDTETTILRSGGVTRGQRERREAPSVPPEILGGQLYEALFGEALRPIFDPTWRGQVFDPGTESFRPADEFDPPDPLRIMLHVDPSNPHMAPLLRMPWELLFRSETREFVSVAAPYTLFRYLEVGGTYAPTRVRLPLRVLVVIASPTDAAPLNVEAERQKIETSWGACRGVQVEFLEDATLQALRRRFQEQPYHVLHYIGHGAFDDPIGKGGLLLESEDGRSEFVDSDTFAVACWRHDEPLQLVFLNACNTAQSSEQVTHDLAAGTAARLVQGGMVPAVLAMQFSISDAAAVVFSEAFYHDLVAELPADVAVANARRAIAERLPGSLEWITPVLYMRSLSGQLFHFASLYG